MRGLIGALIGAVIGTVVVSIGLTFLLGAILSNGQAALGVPVLGIGFGAPVGFVGGALLGWLIGRRTGNK
jgi:hypothetical protein